MMMGDVKATFEGGLSIDPGAVGEQVFALPCRLEFVDGELVSFVVLGARNINYRVRGGESCLSMTCKEPGV